MSVDSDALADVLQELMSPATTTTVDIPTFRSNPVEMTRRAADARGVTMTADEFRLVSEALVHPVAIGTWNLIDRSQDEMEISGLQVARPAFRYAVAMHTIMVLFGLVLLGTSLAASLNGSAQLAAAIGVLGLGSFTALFLVAPLQDLYRSLGTRVQLEIVGLGHQRQMDLFRMYARTTDESDHFLIDAAVLPRITMITERTLALVENLGQPFLPAARPGGALPLVMDPEALGPQGPGRKVFMDKSAFMEASPTGSREGDAAPDSSEGPMQQTKVPADKIMIEPKIIMMEKAPITEAPLPPTEPGTAEDDESQGSD
jgi:hypothetical protein